MRNNEINIPINAGGSTAKCAHWAPCRILHVKQVTELHESAKPQKTNYGEIEAVEFLFIFYQTFLWWKLLSKIRGLAQPKTAESFGRFALGKLRIQ